MKNFWKLWVQHQDYLYQRCLSWMKGNSTDAEEALSRASIKAWEKWQDYSEEIANPKAWLTRLIYNLCMDMHRERSKEAIGMESIEEIALADLPVLDDERNPAINALPAKVRLPFILWYEQEMSYSEIAQQLALSPEKVRKRVQQARTILKKQLNKYFSELDGSFPSATCCKTPITAGCTPDSIDYRVTATCLESLSPTWYSSPSYLRWR